MAMRAGAALVLLVASLVVSLRYTLVTWGAESDIATPYLIWSGLRQYGPGFLTSFRYTADNWLLWPLPLFWMVFSAINTAPITVILIGWSLFILCVLMAYLIVRKVAGTTSASVAATLLLLSNRSAIGAMGFLSYPVTHNATMLGGLIALYAAIRWNEHGRAWWLALLTVSLLICGLSDPWLRVTFLLPLACAAGFGLLAFSPASLARSLALFVCLIGVGILLQTELFGVFNFLPNIPLELDSVPNQLKSLSLTATLAVMWFNVLPLAGTSYLWSPSVGETVLDAALLGITLAGVSALVLRQLSKSVATDMLFIVAGVSVIGTTAAFVGLHLDKSIQTGRYFMASYVLIIMVSCAAAGRAWPRLAAGPRGLLWTICILLGTSGVTSGGPIWWTRPVPPVDQTVSRLIGFLRANDLDYGFSSYFGQQAGAVTWTTRGGITIWPIIFDQATGMVRPRTGQTSPIWFSPAGVPVGRQRTFLVVSDHDDSGCRNVALCVHAVTRQFGTPEETLSFGDARVLVWNYPLLAAAPGLQAARADAYPVGAELETTSSGGEGRILGEGWSVPEAAGTWSDGSRAEILLHLPPGWIGDAHLVLDATAFVPPGRSGQTVTVSVDGHVLATLNVLGGADRPYEVTIPASLLATGSGVVEFSLPRAVSPNELGMGPDLRRLAVSLHSVRLSRD